MASAGLRSAIRHYVFYEDASPEDTRAFVEYSRGLLVRVEAGIVALLGASVIGTWPLDRWLFPHRPDLVASYGAWRVDTLLLVAGFLAVIASRHAQRFALSLFLVGGTGAMFVSAWRFSPLGGADVPFLYISFAFLFMLVPFPLAIVPRTVATLWLQAAFVAGAWVGNPGMVHDLFFPYFILCGNLAAFAAVVFGHIVFHLSRNNFFQKRAIADAHDKNEKLLLNILPRSIADRLKAEPGAIADRLAEVTVLFADIAGFTPLSESMPAEQLVELLNRIFSEFDGLVEELGLEKIKTIGDAYMVAGGLPLPRADHTEGVADLALRMREVASRFVGPDGRRVSLRIGLHTGPVVAGVIGATKFSYDLWGDTVNTASRMESHGEPGEITVSRTTRDRLGDRYTFLDRGQVKVKGKGEMELFFLTGRVEARAAE
jgi:class 3 adenylate cyclase